MSVTQIKSNNMGEFKVILVSEIFRITKEIVSHILYHYYEVKVLSFPPIVNVFRVSLDAICDDRADCR